MAYGSLDISRRPGVAGNRGGVRISKDVVQVDASLQSTREVGSFCRLILIDTGRVVLLTLLARRASGRATRQACTKG